MKYIITYENAWKQKLYFKWPIGWSSWLQDAAVYDDYDKAYSAWLTATRTCMPEHDVIGRVEGYEDRKFLILTKEQARIRASTESLQDKKGI